MARRSLPIECRTGCFCFLEIGIRGSIITVFSRSSPTVDSIAAVMGSPPEQNCADGLNP